MIITLTPNPSLDKTVELDAPLAPGSVQRAPRSSADPGGKGVNISRALTAADVDTLAVLPGDDGDPVLTKLAELNVPFRALRLGQRLRTNITITDPAGLTTKINEAGPMFDDGTIAALLHLTVSAAESASWAALAGSLPPGVPSDFYALAIHELRERASENPPRVALDTSGAPLAASVSARPELIKPNAEELSELYSDLTGCDPGLAPEELEAHPVEVLRLVRATQPFGVQSALVTLGAHGAVLVPPAGAEEPVLRAWGPPIEARSTVGAGDASLAGFLLASQRQASPATSLSQAMGMGRAAAELPGSLMPTPELINTNTVNVETL